METKIAALFLGEALTIITIFASASWGIARALGVTVRKVTVGAVPVVHIYPWGVEVAIGVVPMTASIALAGLNPDEPDEPGSFQRLSLGKQALVILGPWLGIFVVAVTCLGASRALLSAAHGPHQLLLMMDTAPLIRGFLALLRSAPVPVSLGVLAAKMVVFNLVPLPGLAGWLMLRQVAARVSPRVGRVAGSGGFALAGMAVVLLYVGGRFALGLFRSLW